MAHLTAQTSADQQFAREWAEARVGAFDNSFAARYAEHFPELHRLFLLVYGERADGLEALAELVALALRSWNERPGDLKALDAERSADPEWFRSERMLGGVCYVDRYAGSIAKIADHIDYFRELGLTYLHLMPLFRSPERTPAHTSRLRPSPAGRSRRWAAHRRARRGHGWRRHRRRQHGAAVWQRRHDIR